MSMPSIGSVHNPPEPSAVAPTADGARASLSLEGLHLNFGGVAALAGVSLAVGAGELFAIIGPNGAGKTSIFNCISGIYAPTRGRIRFGGQDITRWRPHQRAQLRVEPRRSVAADDRDALASPKAERLEAEADGADVRGVVLPRHFLPDAVLLLAQGDLAAAVTPGMGGQHLRQGHATSTSSPR